MTFQKGDVVQHKSGGPIMSVLSSCIDDKVSCEWWSDTYKKFTNRTFDVALLEKVDKSPACVISVRGGDDDF